MTHSHILLLEGTIFDVKSQGLVTKGMWLSIYKTFVTKLEV